MTELENALELIRKEISKHEMDLRRAEQRNGVRKEELQQLYDKIRLKRLLIMYVSAQERTLDAYRERLRVRGTEVIRLKGQLALLTKGADADGQKGLAPAK